MTMLAVGMWTLLLALALVREEEQHLRRQA
jgi:hypothetical protein